MLNSKRGVVKSECILSTSPVRALATRMRNGSRLTAISRRGTPAGTCAHMPPRWHQTLVSMQPCCCMWALSEHSDSKQLDNSWASK